MIRFDCDYVEGAHPSILEELTRSNLEQTAGYGEDPYCAAARGKIQAACRAPLAAVHFLVGGTQANATVIASILRPHQGVLCAATGHINVHETGAVEATGHKVLGLPHKDGKITAAQVEEAVRNHYADSAFEHIVQPGMVYISHPTVTCPCSWTEQGWATAWPRGTCNCPIWLGCATYSTSAAPSAARCSAKPW